MDASHRSTGASDRHDRWAERLAWYSLLACVALVPLATSITRGIIGDTHALTSDAFQVPKALALAVLLGLATIGWAFDTSLNSRPFRAGPVYVPLGILAVAVVLSTALCPQPLSALFGASDLMTGATTWLLCLWMVVLLGQYVTSGRRLETATWAVLCGFSVVAVIALLQSVRLDPFAMGYPESEIWWTLQGMSTTGNPNATGLLLLLPIALSIGIALAPRSPRRRWIGIGLAVLNGAAAFITLARAAWIGAIAVVAVMALAAYGRRDPRRRRAGIAIIGTALAVVLLGVLVATPHEVEKRFADMGAGIDEYSKGRIALWEVSLRVAADHPLLGAGPDRLGVAGYRVQKEVTIESGNRYVPQDPHNALLLIPALFGIPALVAFIAFVAMTTAAALRTLASQQNESASRTVYAAWLAALAGVGVASLFSVWTITSIFVFFVTVGVLTAPALRATTRRAGAVALVAASAVLVAVALFGNFRSAAASYHAIAATVSDGKYHLEEAMRLVPWDGGTRVDYYWAKLRASQAALTSPDAVAARKAADALDAEIRLAIEEFPDELLLYRLRIDLYSWLKGYPAYDPARLREVIEEGLAAFPGDPEFMERLKALDSGTTP